MMKRDCRLVLGTRLFGIIYLVLFISGCADSFFKKEDVEDVEKVSVTLLIGEEEPQVVLRTIDTPTEAESRINSLTIFTFDTATGEQKRRKIITDTDLENIKTGIFTYKCTIDTDAGSNYTFVVVANLDLSDFSDTGTYQELKKYPLAGNDLPASPFVMYGEQAIINITNQTSIDVSLSRTAFAVSIGSSDEEFELEDEWYLCNGETNGYLSVEIPATISGFTSSLKQTSALSKENKAYSYPRVGAFSDTEETYVVFKGKYKGVSSYYRVALNKINGVQELLSNRLYRLSIVKVTGVGYASLQEAKEAKANKTVVFTVSDWDDTNTIDVIFFGNYFISAERVYFEFDMVQQQASTVVKTNAPDLMVIPPVDGPKAYDPENPEFETAGWTTVSLNKEGISQENPSIKEYRLSVGCFENNDKRRWAYGYVRADGINSDDLKLKYRVAQRMDKSFYTEALRFDLVPNVFYSYSQSSVQEVFESYVTVPISRQSWDIYSVEYYIPSLGRYVHVNDNEMDNYPQYDFIESVSNEDGSVEPKDLPKNYIGNGKVIIKTKTGLEKMPRQARIQISTGSQYYYYSYIYVSQDFDGDYEITYPTDVSDQMKRSRYVIETPLNQTAPLEYTLKIKSNSSWRLYVEPNGNNYYGADARDWIEVDTDHFRYPGDPNDPRDEEGYGEEQIETTVKVTVHPNHSTPEMITDENGNRVYHYPKARIGGLYIQYVGNQTYEGTDEPILSISDQYIYVYQGGYVTISGTDWMDRNLKTGWLFSEEYSSANKGYPLLYPYANPLGLPNDVYGAYSKRNNYFPLITGTDYGDDGLFPSGAQQSGYNGIKNHVDNFMLDFYRDHQKGTAHTSSFYGTKDHTRYWDIPEHTQNFEHNPCPPGWTVPYNANLQQLVQMMQYGTHYGKPDRFPYNQYDMAYEGGNMGVNNSGWVVYLEPLVNGGDSWLLPLFLPAAGARLASRSPMELSGAIGYYKQNEKIKWAEDANGPMVKSNTVMIVSQGGVFLGVQNLEEAASVRCIRKPKIHPIETE